MASWSTRREARARRSSGSTTMAMATPALPVATSFLTMPGCWTRAGKRSTPTYRPAYEALPEVEKKGAKGAQLRAMLTAATIRPRRGGALPGALPGAGRGRDGSSPPEGTGPDGREPGPGALGASRDLLAGCPVPVADPYAHHERGELSWSGRLVWAHRPVPVSRSGKNRWPTAWVLA